MSFPYSFPQVTIPSGTSTSGLALLYDSELVGIIMPAAWTTAPITFIGSDDGNNFFGLFDGTGTNGIKVTTPTPSTYIAIGEETNVKSEHFRGIIGLVIRSGTSGLPVNQTADRVLTLVLKKSTTGVF